MGYKPFKRRSMSAIFCTVLIATGCSGDSESMQASAPTPDPASEAQGSPAETRTDEAVAGQILNSRFTMEQAIISARTLELRQGSEFFADLSAEVVLFDNNPAGKTFQVPAKGADVSPHLRLKQKLEDQNLPESTSLTSNYQLELVFDDPEKLGIPFTIALTVEEHKTEIRGQGFATFDDIKVVDGKLDTTYNSFDTVRLLAREYAAQEHPNLTLGDTFGTTISTYGSDNPASAFVGLEASDINDQPTLIKLQFIKPQTGWEVANELSVDEIHQAHPVLASVEGNLRTVESAKASPVAGEYFERYLQEQSLIDKTRGTSLRCFLSKSADKASCRAAASLKTDDGDTCQRQNYLLTNKGSEWVYEADLSLTQSVDYKGEIVEGRGPSKYSCL